MSIYSILILSPCVVLIGILSYAVVSIARRRLIVCGSPYDDCRQLIIHLLITCAIPSVLTCYLFIFRPVFANEHNNVFSLGTTILAINMVLFAIALYSTKSLNILSHLLTSISYNQFIKYMHINVIYWFCILVVINPPITGHEDTAAMSVALIAERTIFTGYETTLAVAVGLLTVAVYIDAGIMSVSMLQIAKPGSVAVLFTYESLLHYIHGHKQTNTIVRLYGFVREFGAYILMAFIFVLFNILTNKGINPSVTYATILLCVSVFAVHFWPTKAIGFVVATTYTKHNNDYRKPHIILPRLLLNRLVVTFVACVCNILFIIDTGLINLTMGILVATYVLSVLIDYFVVLRIQIANAQVFKIEEREE